MDAHDAAVRARRLGRLRVERDQAPSVAGAERAEAPPATGARSGRDLGDVATALGGRIARYAGSSVIVIEASGRLSMARDRLASLPDPIERGRPLVCLDTETTGLGTAAGTVPFLVGIGTWAGDRFTVRQLFLPDHADEPALLAALASAIPPDAWLVTYNGRSFDWPLLVARYRLHRQGPPTHGGHLDLLTLARQIWRHRLPDARLASVEAGIAGVRRIGDLPGALIPARYFDFLRTGEGGPLVDVIRHNRQDVASLARLLAWLAQGLDPDAFGDSMHPGDLGGLGRAYVRRRRYPEAMACFDAALRWEASDRPGDVPVALVEDRVVADRARLLARLERFDEAAAEWIRLAQRGGTLAALAWVQVAKHREHRQRDAASAVQAAERALAVAARARFIGRPVPWIERDLHHRLARLRRLSARRPALAA